MSRLYGALIVTLGLLAPGVCVETTENPSWELTAGAFSGDLPMVRHALAAGADVNEPSGRSGLESDPPICVAAAGIQSGNANKEGAAIIKELLNAGAEVDARTLDGWTALMRVANSNNLAALNLLLKAGADVNAQADDGRTPLMGAVYIRSADVVERLLEAGADPGLKEADGRTALFYARYHKNKRVISLLEKASGDVSKTKVPDRD